ncbi:MAG: HAD family phosphatase [Bryobacteraceae bacterium]
MTRALIFDLGNVIVPFDFNHAYDRIEPASGLGREEIRRRITERDLPRRLESGKIAEDDFIAEINETLGTEFGYDEFRDIWVSIFFRRTLIPEAFFVAARERYPLILLSNTNSLHFDWVAEQFPLLNHFHGWTLSHRVGAQKPDPRIYADAVARAGCAPEECFFTDDIPDYVEGARRFGLDAEQFTGFGPLREHLAARGIDIPYDGR